MMKYVPLLLVFCSGLSGQLSAQSSQVLDQIIAQYDTYREPSLTDRRFKHADILPLIEQFGEPPEVSVEQLGSSIEGRAIYQLKLGRGPIKVLLWSQMHGDESTATMALFDLLKLFTSGDHAAWREDLLSKVSLYMIPMLNPDGAERYTRRNRLGVDLNRDALRLQSPEARILKAARDRLDADFGFNLHDQGRVYTAGFSDQPATISFLAPAYNYEKDINEVRGNAMKLIALMNRRLQQHIPGRVGKYNDDFEPRAFGDNIQKWGTSTILIESGGARGDREKQSIRKVNFIALLSGIHAIAHGTYADESLQDYEQIPFNERLLYDLLIRQAEIELLGKPYTVDIAINRYERDLPGNRSFEFASRVAEWGDLSIYHGYKEIMANGLRASQGAVYPELITHERQVRELKAEALLKQGYTHLRVKRKKLSEASLRPLPFEVLDKKEPFRASLGLGSQATLVLRDEASNVRFVIINGAVVYEAP